MFTKKTEEVKKNIGGTVAKKKIDKNKVITRAKVITKIVLFITILVLSYVVSDRVVDFLLTLSIEMLKRSLNIIIVAICIFFLAKK